MSTILVRRTALAIVVGVATIGTVAAQSTSAQRRTPMRFAAMDANRDGVITRKEWNGSDRSFEVQDWNRDGILSGDEVRQGVRRRGDDDRNTGSTDRYFDDWTVRGFSTLDRNRDDRVSREEWESDDETFRRVDANRNGTLSRAEFLGDDTPDPGAGGRAGRPGSRETRDRFASLDTNNDSRVSRAEWTGTAERFAMLDTNRDAFLSRQELGGTQSAPRTEAWTQGRARGLSEGREAGRADRQQRNAWDLEGQRELETADAGYEPRYGVKAEYQAGYREGFRLGYGEGFGPR